MRHATYQEVIHACSKANTNKKGDVAARIAARMLVEACTDLDF